MPAPRGLEGAGTGEKNKKKKKNRKAKGVVEGGQRSGKDEAAIR
jgi:hypothetical protein